MGCCGCASCCARIGRPYQGLAQICIELSWETKTSSHSGHGQGHQVIEVAVGRCSQLECAEANVIESFIVNTESFVSVFHQLVDGQGGIVWLNHSIGNFGGGHN